MSESEHATSTSDDLKPTPSPDEKDYFCLLGMFVAIFANVESHIFICLVLVSGLDIDAGRAVFSGTRAKDAMDHIKRLFRVRETNQELQNVLMSCFEQLNAVNDVRNSIIHYGIDVRLDNPVSSNFVRALGEEKLKSFSVSRETLNNLIDDLLAISSSVLYCCILLYKERYPNVRAPSPPKALKHVVQRTWRYKSPSQASKMSKLPDNSQRRQRQPPPSAE